MEHTETSLKSRFTAFLSTADPSSQEQQMTAFVIRWTPLTITDDFEHSIVVRNEELESILSSSPDQAGTYLMHLIDWRFALTSNPTDGSADEVALFCSTYRIVKEPEDLLEVDIIPPDLRSAEEFKQPLLQKVLLAKAKARKPKPSIQAPKNDPNKENLLNGICTSKNDSLSTASSDKNSNSLSISDLLNTTADSALIAAKKRTSQLSKHPRKADQELRERSRSKSASKQQADVITLSSDEEGFESRSEFYKRK